MCIFFRWDWHFRIRPNENASNKTKYEVHRRIIPEVSRQSFTKVMVFYKNPDMYVHILLACNNVFIIARSLTAFDISQFI